MAIHYKLPFLSDSSVNTSTCNIITGLMIFFCTLFCPDCLLSIFCTEYVVLHFIFKMYWFAYNLMVGGLSYVLVHFFVNM